MYWQETVCSGGSWGLGCEGKGVQTGGAGRQGCWGACWREHRRCQRVARWRGWVRGIAGSWGSQGQGVVGGALGHS